MDLLKTRAYNMYIHTSLLLNCDERQFWIKGQTDECLDVYDLSFLPSSRPLSPPHPTCSHTQVRDDLSVTSAACDRIARNFIISLYYPLMM